MQMLRSQHLDECVSCLKAHLAWRRDCISFLTSAVLTDINTVAESIVDYQSILGYIITNIIAFIVVATVWCKVTLFLVDVCKTFFDRKRKPT